ncbi:MAG TPA: erythromycin esterase family protein [Leptospiraceae bacterium]|nr:erythromycin esterase family protein [Leptospiraceae bacterium]HNH03067.1 erythromycin esterase family protein [Leptospiraceae bacterium]HNI90593.1 erythromycin esterase family protein [Leptospiraceae bacterium]
MENGKTLSISDWIKSNFIPFHSISSEDSFYDLEPLRDIIGNAKVVALGENSHFIKEFCQIRFRILRFLVEKCGFNVHALEFGFTEGFEVNNWIHNHERKEEELIDLLGHFPYPPEIHDTIKWIRNYNKSKSKPLDFVGIDVPRNGGSFFPSLEVINDFFKVADPDGLVFISDIWDITKKIDGFSTAQSAFMLNKISDTEKDKITSRINRLLYRLEALAPQHLSRFGEKKYNTIYQHLKSICYLDYNSHAMNGFISGKGLPGDMGARDKFMADSILWHLNNSSSKIVLIAHNAHIQKQPIQYGDFLSCLPMGQRLSSSLGSDYISFGLTSVSGHTAALFPDENSKFGFRIENTELSMPVSGSIEKILEEAQVENGIISFKQIPRGSNDPTLIRFDSEYIETSVIDAFDGLIQVPTSSIADGIAY